MATTKTTCFIAVCDGCDLEFDQGYIVHCPSVMDAVGAATEADWVQVGEKLYCEHCAEGKGVSCAGCDDLVMFEGDRCESCRQEERREIKAPS